MGTHDSLVEASIFIRAIEERQGLKIGCIEEIAYNLGYVNVSGLRKIADSMPASYGDYLRKVLKNE
jgi:glucose-1-phosphate thymidylyltransferase